MKLIVSIPKEEYKLLQNSSFHTVIEECVRNGIPIPDNTTNGDVIMAMFPYIKVEEHDESNTIIWTLDGLNHHQFDKNWWNAQYQKGMRNDDELCPFLREEKDDEYCSNDGYCQYQYQYQLKEKDSDGNIVCLCRNCW